MVFDNSEIYLAVFTGTGLMLAWGMHLWLRRTEKKRADYIQNLDQVNEVVETSTTQKSTAKKSKTRALESVETRFRLMRRLLVPSFLLIWLCGLSFPYLEQLPATLISVLVGALTVVLGIAARPLVENVIAGIVVSTSQPFRLGDTLLIEGHFGTVEDITLTHTVIKRWDWRRYVISNHRLLQLEYLNYSLVDSWQWAYAQVWVSHDTDLDQLAAVGANAVSASEHAVEGEDAGFWVMNMDKDAVECWLAGWALSPSAGWLLTHDIRTAVVKHFQSEGIKGQVLHHRWAGGQDTPISGPAPMPGLGAPGVATSTS